MNVSKLLLTSAATVSILASSTYIHATTLSSTINNGVYVSGSGGADFSSEATNNLKLSSYKTGWNTAGAVGYRFNNFRFEGNIGYVDAPVNKFSSKLPGNVESTGGINLTTFLVNAYYDINTNSAFVPYIGAGLGGGYLTLDDLGYKKMIGKKSGYDRWDSSHTDFAYNLKVGLGYNVNQSLRISINYTYLDLVASQFTATGKTNVKDEKIVPSYKEKRKVKVGFNTNLINLGLTYFF